MIVRHFNYYYLSFVKLEFIKNTIEIILGIKGKHVIIKYSNILFDSPIKRKYCVYPYDNELKLLPFYRPWDEEVE